VTRIPVTDFDQAKAFYRRLGWELDIDFQFTEHVRVCNSLPGIPSVGPVRAARRSAA